MISSLINDLQKLEIEGIIVSGKRFYGAVSKVVGDNLGQYSIGGIMESFNVVHFCRYCLCQLDMMQCYHNDTELPKRTPELHEEHLELVEINTNYISIYGTKGYSAFSALSYFDLIKQQLLYFTWHYGRSGSRCCHEYDNC